MIAAVAVTVGLAFAPSPGPALHDALRTAMTDRFYAVIAWNAAVEAREAADREAAALARTRRRPAIPATVGAGSGWNAVAACESSGDWTANTGNGYFGGLQMTPAFWRQYGGLAYAPRPDLATPAEQIAVAERAGSRAPWPTCGNR